MLAAGRAATIRTLSPAGRRARLTIFCYHQVLPQKDPLRPGEPDIAEFERDIEILSETFELLPLSDAIQRLRERSLPAGAACISFDDGYADNLEHAAPVLERARVPAVFYVAANAVDEGVMWNDLIIEGFAECGVDSDLGCLPFSVDKDLLRSRTSEGVHDVLRRLKYVPLEQRWRIAETFYRNSTGKSIPRLMMTRDQIAELAHRGFEIGGHTMNHPILKELENPAAEREIHDCYRWVHEVTGKAPRSFAYPNGVPDRDFTEDHERIVQEAGFECAVSTQWSVAKYSTSPYRVPRVGPWWRQGYGLVPGLARNYLRSYLS